MLRFRTKRRTAEAARATAALAAIRAAVVALDDEDLLDLADIFSRQGASPLKAVAADEMRRRAISL